MKCEICHERRADLLNHREIHHVPYSLFICYYKNDPSIINICYRCHTKIHKKFKKEFGELASDIEELIEKTLNGEFSLKDLLLIECLLDWQRRLKDRSLGDIVFRIERYARR
jgi:hypothetical protein